MKIEKIVLRKMKMTFKTPFQVSFATMREKHFIAAEIHTKDHIGYGDCSAFDHPYYNEETTTTAWHILQDFLIPLLFSKDEISHPEELYSLFSHIRRNKMAKSALDCAVWDLYAKERNIPLSKALGGTRSKIETGVSIGIQNSPDDLLRVVEKYMEEGYRRVKIKIKPGKDIKYLEAIRKRFGDIMLMADANSAYTLKDIELFKEMDPLNLIMIEQPLAHDDIVDHAKLQAVLKTRICLDESIHSVEDARKAIELGSTKTINIKVARVGGLTAAKKIHDLCQAHDIPVWCGGMLDTGIARAHNVAIASLPNYRFPGDIPASNRYWNQDVISPEVTIDEKAMVAVPEKAGIGFEPIPELMERFTYEKKQILR
ncbi:o-succinylbenzoate synthase [Geosporobacter ferrireducens]|uniref:o-succinylbenzoate synthase n=1 Tax=Geosporobacter ferrireducens TaxID=1424294 RepID=A0A1D8GMB1_9FIRM|nr:o-succinylbenzoate synthase [Geosporobacter ferrireducens]AOT72066.1 o-succinylbenzoate synthase [Geosporobacter ferrireducens]MTI55951.1 o-succinylbenzoate synthase [Geosporobacter ferrireducens]